MYSPSQKLSDLLSSTLKEYFQNVDNEHLQVRSSSLHNPLFRTGPPFSRQNLFLFWAGALHQAAQYGVEWLPTRQAA